ncbi:rubrerythrin [Candidatus Pacearchaeota archaeon]|nr:rubrerythrin [Candidatus Pacearchaeota archaeon]
MLSKEPIDFKNVKKEDKDKEILRLGMIAELDAVNLYEQLAAETDNKKLKAILLDVAKEEKTHIGEFQTLLLELDKEQAKELEEGKKEVEEETANL